MFDISFDTILSSELSYFIAAFSVLFVLNFVASTRKLKRSRTRSAKLYNFSNDRQKTKRRNMAIPSNQMDAISKIDFKTTKLVNKSEYRVLLALEGIVRDLKQGHRVMAQTSLGELLEPADKTADLELRRQAYASINSKRLDFVIIDCKGHAVIALEYQGGGHYSTSAFMRDAVKKEVLRKAGVFFEEVDHTWTPASLKDRITHLLNQKNGGIAPNRTRPHDNS